MNVENWFTDLENSLPLHLATLGYDVWLGNNRGAAVPTYSKHIYLNRYKDNNKYWAYSFTEMGQFDLPAEIDYILELTKARTVSFIGLERGLN